MRAPRARGKGHRVPCNALAESGGANQAEGGNEEPREREGAGTVAKVPCGHCFEPAGTAGAIATGNRRSQERTA